MKPISTAPPIRLDVIVAGEMTDVFTAIFSRAKKPLCAATNSGHSLAVRDIDARVIVTTSLAGCAEAPWPLAAMQAPASINVSHARFIAILLFAILSRAYFSQCCVTMDIT